MWQLLNDDGVSLLDLVRLDRDVSHAISREDLPTLTPDGAFQPVPGTSATVYAGSDRLRASSYTLTVTVVGRTHADLLAALRRLTDAATKTRWVRRSGLVLPVAGFAQIKPSFRGAPRYGGEFTVEFMPAWPYWMAAEQRVRVEVPNLVFDPSMSGEVWSGAARPSAELYTGATTATARAWQGRDFTERDFRDVQAGQVYEVTVQLAAPNGPNRWPLNLGMWFRKPDGANTWISGRLIEPGGLQPGAWRFFSATVTVPDGYSRGRFWMNQDTFSDFDSLWVAGASYRRWDQHEQRLMVLGDADVSPVLVLYPRRDAVDATIHTAAGVTRLLGALPAWKPLVIDARPGEWTVTVDGVDRSLDLRGPMPLLRRGESVVRTVPPMDGEIIYRPGVLVPDEPNFIPAPSGYEWEGREW